MNRPTTERSTALLYVSRKELEAELIILTHRFRKLRRALGLDRLPSEQQNAPTQPAAALQGEMIAFARGDLEIELSWVTQRIHRLRDALGFAQLLTPRREKRMQIAAEGRR